MPLIVSILVPISYEHLPLAVYKGTFSLSLTQEGLKCRLYQKG